MIVLQNCLFYLLPKIIMILIIVQDIMKFLWIKVYKDRVLVPVLMGLLITPVSRKMHKSWIDRTIFVRFWGKLEHGSAMGHCNFQEICRFRTDARAWGAKKQVTATFSKAWTRVTVASEPFVDQMRRGSVHVNASQKTFKNIYARFHTFHRMGAFLTGWIPVLVGLLTGF